MIRKTGIAIDARKMWRESWRHCPSCGLQIRATIHEFEDFRDCPHRSCRKPLPLIVEPNEFQEGLGRCQNCKLYIREADLYCQACGLRNKSAWERMAREKISQQNRMKGGVKLPTMIIALTFFFLVVICALYILM